MLAAAGCPEEIGTVLADGGYWNNAHIAALGDEGMQVIVPTRSASRTKARTLSPKQGPRLTGSTGSWKRRRATRSTPAAST